MTVVAFLGPVGTFTEAAVFAFAKDKLFTAVELLPVANPAAAAQAVRAGAADYAVLAIENSIDGAVTQSFDALAEGGVQIRAEVDLPIAFSVMVTPGHTGKILKFSSHPVGYQQIKGWVAQHYPEAEFVPASSNAAAAEMVAKGLVDAAAAPHRAAEIWGLETIAEGVADRKDSRTRFVAISKPAISPRTGADRTSVVFTLPNAPGTLVRALNEFASRGVDLSRIESRPTRKEFGQYSFSVDLIGHLEDAPVAAALAALQAQAETITYLGSWPRVTAETTI
ncbi:prephenate dehydratase [Corynebacterium caspium]|uniref:prephenate dehydratase n=1 Tax=Corynebacterium caspium TaxID=234828 RepID=UPI00035D935B|nr:prephenate dehydratase [Corynebacterium caspium]WKD60000.1 Prephenate dehydratase [Corynebacterium caspium DSM 44850]